MLKIIKESEFVEETRYEKCFYYDMNGGYAFPCDKDGNVFPFECDSARKSYEKCIAHPEVFEDIYVRTITDRYREPAVGECECGEAFPLQSQMYGACQCPNCGRWYNLFGQELKSPEHWFDDGE